MTSKKNFFLITSLFLSLVLSIALIKREELVYLLPVKDPQTLRDLAYDKDKRLGYTVHIKEDGKLVPYLVLTKNYIGQGNVLLLRKHLVDPPMSFRDSWEEAYYGHSIPDAFMHKDFIKRFSKGVKDRIPLTEIAIEPLEPTSSKRYLEKIERKLFLLSDIDVGNFKDGLRLEGDCNLLYFRRKGGIREDRLAYLEGDHVSYPWWLRTVFETASAVVKVIGYEGRFGGNGVVYPAYVRPAFTLPPETEVEEKEINGHKEYVLKIDK
ncbi:MULTISPECIES: DUF6273 domain-containing protein [Lactococcus]|uniref:DUF6273 domain-containing protein n=1 Tax=Lactococcus petauri TaxID=1940789 RepID=A0AAJ2IYV6_9LACT|nr:MULTISPECIES: DUF6273 domain-containing protein [Lactococcus]MCH1712897.1 DUF6273 domain-containing protein [Lactococcus petauri]MDT2527334.1 DUF6273 domain-containing protein [Lactococcus petauri]MDT2542003.1 DUF6273 domain-containing protein [Lactococcus petauri]MDT2558602.1 DUF6273 domain-containing protein [Lactococcus petauri]MDT2560711.1 DUF6273 domain-containing protein [Lactococcus petauri]